MSLRVGYFPHNNSLFVLRHTGLLEQRLPDVTWVDLRDLPQGDRPDIRSGLPTVHSDQLFADGGYDVIGTGFTPPVTGLAHGRDLVYVGISGPRLENGRLVVRADSDIRTVADLVGRRVALAHGSWQTTLVLFALADAGLSWSDIEPVDASVSAGQQLVDGDGDAWVGSYPSLTDVEARTELRTLVETDGLFSHPSLWFTRRDVADEQPEALRAVIEALQESDAWIAAQPREAAQLFVDDARSRSTRSDHFDRGADADLDAWEHALTARPWGVRPVDDAFLDEQQRAADLLHANGLLPIRVDVRSAVVPWISEAVSATLTPST